MTARRLCDIRRDFCQPVCPDCAAAIEAAIAEVELDCDAETIGMCDADPNGRGRYIHDCHHADGHDSPHQCACGHTWTDPDDG